MLKIPDFITITSNQEDVPYLRQAYKFGLENANDRSTKNGAVLLNRSGEIIESFE